MKPASATAPAHLTGLFQIYDKEKDFFKNGSRGAGVCLSEGLITEVEVKGAKRKKIEIFLNSKPARAEVSRKVAEELLGNKNLNIIIKSFFSLPLSQGFGISGAGALSTALALNEALELKLSYEKIMAVAHKAELLCKTGLGDVVAQSLGGFEIRLKEGLPPFGLIKNVPWHKENKIVVSVLGKVIKTKSVLTSPTLRAKINLYGRKCLKKLTQNLCVENFFAKSNEFALRTGLATKKINEVIEKCQKYGYAAQSMLGNSVFAVGNTKKLVEILKSYATTYICRIGERAKVLL